METKLDKGLGVGAVVGAATAFSWGFSIVKLLGLPAPTLACWRLALGGAALALVALVLRLPWPSDLRSVIGAGLCFGLHQLLYISATQRTSIAIVTLLGALSPLVVAVASLRTVGERVPRSFWLWGLLAAAGVGVVVHANLGDASRSWIGDGLAVLNLLVFTSFFLFSKRARQEGAHTVTLTAGVQGIALAVVALALPFVEQRTPPTAMHWGLLALLALGPGNGHLLLNWAHRRVSAALAALLLAAVPLLASIWAHLLFGEPYGWRHVAGMLLVAVAIEGGRRAEMNKLSGTAPAPVPARPADKEASCSPSG